MPLPPLLERLKIRSVLLVTDRPLREAGVARGLKGLQERSAVRRRSQALNIPAKPPEIRREDIPAMAARAAREATPFAPAPS